MTNALARAFNQAWSGLEPQPKGALLDFCRRRSQPRWIDGPHLNLLTTVLQDCIEAAMQKRGYHQMILMPPRHSKSHCTDVMLPAWSLGTFKDLNIILTSYGAHFAQSRSRMCRNLLRKVGPSEFGVVVDESHDSVADWQLEGYAGRLSASGAGGPVMGEGAQLGILDDPYKNIQEARSLQRRQTIWDWWTSDFLTRIEAGGSVILMLTRWHEFDIAGMELKERGRVEEGGLWHVLKLPALSKGKDKDPLKRPKGEALWPERGWTKEQIGERRKIIGEHEFAARFQQEPRPAEGTLFSRNNFRYYKAVEHKREACYELTFGDGSKEYVRVRDCWGILTADTALSEKQTADYTALEHWLITPAVRGRRRKLLHDVIRERMEQPKQIPVMERTYKTSKAKFIGIESAQAGLAAVQHARQAGLPVRECKADKDKVARAMPLTASYEAEDIFHRADGEWLVEFEAELLVFPQGLHDDQVDAAAYADILFRTLAGEYVGTQIDPVSLEAANYWRSGLAMSVEPMT